MRIETYVLPVYWAPHLYYGDAGGYSESDLTAIQRWWDATFGNRAVTVGDNEDAGFVVYHDARSFAPFAAECATFSFLVHEDKL